MPEIAAIQCLPAVAISSVRHRPASASQLFPTTPRGAPRDGREPCDAARGRLNVTDLPSIKLKYRDCAAAWQGSS